MNRLLDLVYLVAFKVLGHNVHLFPRSFSPLRYAVTYFAFFRHDYPRYHESNNPENHIPGVARSERDAGPKSENPEEEYRKKSHVFLSIIVGLHIFAFYRFGYAVKDAVDWFITSYRIDGLNEAPTTVSLSQC